MSSGDTQPGENNPFTLLELFHHSRSLKCPFLNLAKADWTTLGPLHDRDIPGRLAAYLIWREVPRGE
ncbi:hypothetical protein TNCV_2500071 [Trichonephila clavipes]|nr:hypothetical protein TNCV_2500071 [Trichonephila clavipes]